MGMRLLVCTSFNSLDTRRLICTAARFENGGTTYIGASLLIRAEPLMREEKALAAQRA